MNILTHTFEVFDPLSQHTSSLWFQELLELQPRTLLYFYPKNDTPGCTIENQDFSGMKEDFEALWVQLIGVSRDTTGSHKNFCEKYGLHNPLISDPDLILHKQFWAWGEKNNYGKIVQGVIRSTFLIDSKGTILREWRNVRAKGHTLRVLEELQGEG